MAEDEVKEKLERLRRKIGGHEGSVTKKKRGSTTVRQDNRGSQEVSDNGRSRLNVLRQILEQKQKLLEGYDEEILDLCPVAAIDKEIDEADEANSKNCRNS